MNQFEITVLVASYNPSWKSLERTICSILNQTSINMQIVVADDGSKYNYFKEIEELFRTYHFKNFKLVSLNSNKGTCSNIFNGLQYSKGEYVKTIGPGDCLFDSFTLKNWYHFAKQNEATVCFGDAVFFTGEENNEQIISKRRYPQNVKPYQNLYSTKEVVYNYILLGDVIWGANLLTNRSTLTDYLKSLLNSIKYAEDMAYRLMVANGEKIIYYPKNVIWYEYGTGISTSKNQTWNSIISKERQISNSFLINTNLFQGFSRKRFQLAVKYLSNKKISWIKYFLFPTLIHKKLQKEIIRATTDSSSNIKQLLEISTNKFKK